MVATGSTGRFTETTPYAPNSPYSASKAGSDHLARAYFHTYGMPVLMLTGPLDATQKLLSDNDLSIEDIDVFEINEAFASVVLAWAKEVGADLEKTNPNGGAIALGHPLGATGTKLMTTLLHELERTGGKYGLQTMCEGGGQANVTIIERLG